MALIAWRTRRIFWILALFVLFFFVAPVVFHAAFGRTFYAALPVAYFLMALLALYPYFAETGEPFEFEREYLIALEHRLSSSGAANPTPYRALTMEQLLPMLAAPPAGIERAMVIWWNWDNLPRNEERLAILTQLQTCYPAMTHLKGLHFDCYIILNLQQGALCVAGFARNVP